MSADRELLLADLTAFRPHGRCILFVRPRRPLSDEEWKRVSDGARFMPAGVVQMLVPHDFELMALGDAEMERLGWMRVPVPEPPPPAFERTAP